jgi:Na+-translocating ferredoxin:NAD+ oxidoreductase RnfD subunit
MNNVVVAANGGERPLAPALRRLRRFLRSPKGFLLVALLALSVVAAPRAGITDAAQILVAATLGATAMELICVRLESGAWRFPSSALLSGLIVGLVLSAQEPWYVAAAAGILATDAKHLLRLGRSHLFNPAAVGLLAVFFLFHSGQSWWGALADLPAPAIALLLVAGVLVAQRANKLPAALAFLVVYAGLGTLAAFTGDPVKVADLYRPPFVNMALFFALFMVTDPPTSPVAFPGQMLFGVVVGAASALTYLATHGLYYLLVAVLLANGGYGLARFAARSWRRRPAAQPREAPAGGVPPRLLGIAAAAAGLVLLLVLAAGVAVLRSEQHGGADDAPPPPSVAQTTTLTAASGPPLPLEQPFAGTLSQRRSGAGVAVTIHVSGTGRQALQLDVNLLVNQGDDGQSVVQGNQAVLRDATGAQLCQGGLLSMDDAGFSAQCQGAGAYAGKTLQLQGTITALSGTQLQGQLHVSSVGG